MKAAAIIVCLILLIIIVSLFCSLILIPNDEELEELQLEKLKGSDQNETN